MTSIVNFKESMVETLDLNSWVKNGEVKLEENKLSSFMNLDYINSNLLLVKSNLKMEHKKSDCEHIKNIEIPVYCFIADKERNRPSNKILTFKELKHLGKNLPTEFAYYFFSFESINKKDIDLNMNKNEIFFIENNLYALLIERTNCIPSGVHVDVDSMKIVASSF